MTIDIKDYYLVTPMNRYEYMKIPVKHIPEDIMLQYNLTNLIVNDHVMVEIRKGMYGLPQAVIIAQERLNKHLKITGILQPTPHLDYTRKIFVAPLLPSS